MESRIKLEGTIQDAIVSMSDGNPGAIMAMAQIMQEYEAIDPQSAFGAFGAIMSLDTHGIYGTDIYVLYNDKCNRSVRDLAVLMRGVQLGMFPESRLKELAGDQMYEVNLSEDERKELDEKVCEQLEDFAKAA